MANISPKDTGTELLEISRRAMIGICEELRQEVEQQSNPVPAVSPKRKALLEALAKARVLRHERPWVCPEAVQPFWDGAQLPTRPQMEGCAGEAKAFIPHLTGLDDDLAPWTAGFWHGLRLSGALVIHGGYPRLQSDRPWLEEDLERLPFPGGLSPPDCQGRRWLIRCQAWRLPVTQALGADVLAGLLAGARRETAADGIWLVVPRTEPVMRLVTWWGVSTTKGNTANELRISPFYGTLLSGRMSVACTMSMLVRPAGDCPLLPLAIWEATWGPGGPPGYLLPDRAGALPFICGDATRKRHGWTRDFLHSAAVRLGVAQASPEMRRLLKGWRKAHTNAAATAAAPALLGSPIAHSVAWWMPNNS